MPRKARKRAAPLMSRLSQSFQFFNTIALYPIRRPLFTTFRTQNREASPASRKARRMA